MYKVMCLGPDKCVCIYVSARVNVSVSAMFVYFPNHLTIYLCPNLAQRLAHSVMDHLEVDFSSSGARPLWGGFF